MNLKLFYRPFKNNYFLQGRLFKYVGCFSYSMIIIPLDGLVIRYCGEVKDLV